MSVSPSLPVWISESRDGAILRLQIQPKASRSETVGLHGDRLKVRIAAPPVDGEANAELVEFLRKKLGVPKSQIRIIRGETARTKDVLCVGLSADTVLKTLGEMGV